MNLLELDLFQLLLFALLAAVSLFLGYKGGYFQIQAGKEETFSEIRWFHPITAFAIYFAVAYFVVHYLIHILEIILGPSIEVPYLHFASWLNLITSLTIASLLYLYFSTLPKPVSQLIWQRGNRTSFLEDTKWAALSWIISFGPILLISTLLEQFTLHFFHMKALPEQLAVNFLKMTFEAPFYFFLALCTVIFLAPLIEELLFRGFLQTFLRKHLSRGHAIFLSSLCFSFFHYSPEQGFANIPIIGSLFLLALFLGFLYEKRLSLKAPILLHALFNTTSVINLYFLGGFPKGPL